MSLGAVGQTKGVLQELMDEYQQKDSALEITLFEDRYRMRVKDVYLPKVQHLTLSTDYSRASLKTLSVVAFKQPILQSEVVKMRGQGTYEHVKDLSTGGLISARKHGRSKLLSTTKRFEDYFGTSVDKLKETYGDIEIYVPEGEGEGVAEITTEQTRIEEPVEVAQEQTEGEETDQETTQEQNDSSEETPKEEDVEEVQEVVAEIPEEAPTEVEETAEEEETTQEQNDSSEEGVQEAPEEDDLTPSERAELESQKDI
jgi:segregation and condensation protein B